MTTKDVQLKACVNAMRMLRGIPPHDEPSNICRSDGYFARSIRQDYPVEIVTKATLIVDAEERRWQRTRHAFIKGCKP